MMFGISEGLNCDFPLKTVDDEAFHAEKVLMIREINR